MVFVFTMVPISVGEPEFSIVNVPPDLPISLKVQLNAFMVPDWLCTSSAPVPTLPLNKQESIVTVPPLLPIAAPLRLVEVV